MVLLQPVLGGDGLIPLRLPSLLLLAALLPAACAPVRPAGLPRSGPGPDPSVDARGVARSGRAWLRREGPTRGILVLRAAGGGYERGHAIGRLLGGFMSAEETHLTELLSALVPSSVVRWALLQASSVAMRNIARDVPAEVIAEVAGLADGYEALGHRPGWSTYRRIVGLHAVHDISQRFVDAPVLSSACTGFAASGSSVDGGGTLLARNFDFEGGELLERTKVVVVAVPDGRLPYLSVTFTGMAGVVSGFNAAGLGLVIQSVTGGPTATTGTPFTLLAADVLASERTLDGAIERLRAARVFVSDLVLLADGKDGGLALVEKTPRSFEVLARLAGGTLPAANSGRSAAPRGTSPARLARMEELLRARAARAPLSVADAVSVLRDRRGASGRPLGPGNRSAVDALIATHSIVFDLARRIAWVAESPHTLGAYVPVSLDAVVADARGDGAAAAAEPLPADPFVLEGGYGRAMAMRAAVFAARRRAHEGDTGAVAAARALLEPWARESEPSVDLLATLGELRARAGAGPVALQALDAALALDPSPPEVRSAIGALRDAVRRGEPPARLPALALPLLPDELIAARRGR